MNVKLKGENRIEPFRQVAERLVSKISAHESVAGTIILGGLVRGFVDKFSDLDTTVFLSGKDENVRTQIYNLGLEERRRSGIDIDLEIHFLEDFKRRKLDETKRWDLSNAEIAFDPKGEIRKMIKAKLRVPKKFWITRIALCSEYIKWYCCPPKDSVGTIAQAWIDRGDLVSAHYSLNYAVEQLLKVIFTLNKEFLPPPKWRIFYSSRLKWIPKNYKELLREAMKAKNMSTRDLNRRLKAIRKTWHEILPKIRDKTGLTPSQMSQYYVQRILRQTQFAKTFRKSN